MMKKIVPLIIVLLFITSFSNAHAQLKTFVKEYTYQASEDDSRNSSRTIALREVKRLLLEELGTYLESVTEVHNFQLTKDQIVTLTAGVVRTEIIDEKWDGRIYWLSAKIVANSGEVIKSVNTLRQDRTKTKELEELRARSEAQLRDIESLKAELKIAKGDNREKVKAAYENKIKSLSATEWFEKGYASQTSDRDTEAIEAYSKAIELNPTFSRAYRNRGIVYGSIKNYIQAAKDLDKAINLSLYDPLAYISMAIVLHDMGNIKQALANLNTAIEIEPKFAWAYVVRGAYYNISGNYGKAIEDFNTAIELDPKIAEAYRDRGAVHHYLGKYKQAMSDYDRAIVLDPKDAKSYSYRGGLYYKLSNFKEAIENFNKAIELKPKYARAYGQRGATKYSIGDCKQAIEDWKIAARLGDELSQHLVEKRRDELLNNCPGFSVNPNQKHY